MRALVSTPWARTSRPCWRCKARARSRSTTATTSARRRKTAGVEDAFDIPGFVPEYIRPLFCEGRGPFRWVALSGDPEDIYRTDRLALELFPHNETLARWMPLARERIHFQGLPARICWLGYGERAEFGLAMNRLVRRGRIESAHRDRPRPSGHRLRGVALPRNRSHARRLATPSPIGRCSTRWSTPPRARPGSPSTTAAAWASATRSTPEWWWWPTARDGMRAPPGARADQRSRHWA